VDFDKTFWLSAEDMNALRQQISAADMNALRHFLSTTYAKILPVLLL